jgi:hypothetical protein
MGLHSPFGYVNYETQMANLFFHVLDKLCAHCHTNRDYQEGCRGCPAGNLVFECKEYILCAIESDKQFELYASEEWAKRAVRKASPEGQAKDREMAQDYKPECDFLRAMKQKIKRITPHPLFYVRGGKKGYRCTKTLTNFVELAREYEKLREVRLRKWGLWDGC